MSNAQAFVALVESKIRERIFAGRRQDVREIAEDLFCGKSTLQRRLEAAGTTFTQVRSRARVEYALEQLTEGRSVAQTARMVGISQSYLSKLIKADTGVTAGEITRAYALRDRAVQWAGYLPPEYGTKLYFKQIDDWRRLRRELEDLLGRMPADGPLRAWANLVDRQAQRPDYRTRPYRQQVRRERARQRQRDHEALMRALRWGAELRRTGTVPPVDELFRDAAA